ncbi:MAG: hypothetical protein M3Z30_13305 [Gemmatimonadota bacterium]|nr:hypothetical protein [Gemmatimonadota bacterium]
MPKDTTIIPATTSPLIHRRFIWWGLAAATLLVGYADLWRGGETAAPVLLVIAYCVLIPVAILKR